MVYKPGNQNHQSLILIRSSWSSVTKATVLEMALLPLQGGHCFHTERKGSTVQLLADFFFTWALVTLEKKAVGNWTTLVLMHLEFI